MVVVPAALPVTKPPDTEAIVVSADDHVPPAIEGVSVNELATQAVVVVELKVGAVAETTESDADDNVVQPPVPLIA